MIPQPLELFTQTLTPIVHAAANLLPTGLPLHDVAGGAVTACLAAEAPEPSVKAIRKLMATAPATATGTPAAALDGVTDPMARLALKQCTKTQGKTTCPQRSGAVLLSHNSETS